MVIATDGIPPFDFFGFSQSPSIGIALLQAGYL